MISLVRPPSVIFIYSVIAIAIVTLETAFVAQADDVPTDEMNSCIAISSEDIHSYGRNKSLADYCDCLETTQSWNISTILDCNPKCSDATDDEALLECTADKFIEDIDEPLCNYTEGGLPAIASAYDCVYVAVHLLYDNDTNSTDAAINVTSCAENLGLPTEFAECITSVLTS